MEPTPTGVACRRLNLTHNLRCLPLCSARPKPIEEAPAAPTEGQLPACAWAAAGTRFTVALRLVRPLWEPWEPPAQPGRQLADLFPPHPPPAAPPAPTAVDRLREKVRCVLQ